jgi:hypothetical protein
LRPKTARCGLSWTSSWALLPVVALDCQRLEGGQEPSLGTTRNILPIITLNLAAEDQAQEHEMSAAAKIGWLKDRK